ncbi:MAG: 50S ribosomal protein L17 [Bacteroidales bacterium]|uniref:50S ribosomal protein L17 n=1 Tax=Porphyromonas sp. TaxID=1924944 RepID=UPI0029724763|nr:50S ribosomal protein L17 [Porphyromonas sp.]MDD7438270.1 50S ribosomal protein L17 [Bacteroidales bacterium]MDY3066695.1 50S ribosomal protein L17 [Porphyromonas sp.]
MRHNNKFNSLGRTASHRQAMLSNMANSLIQHKRIFTTLAKAKALKVYVEPIITKAKNTESVHARRVVFQKLQNRDSVVELFGPIAEKVGDRPGGYCRILKTGRRQGDDAMMCLIELVDFNENRVKEDKASKGSKTRRTRRSKKAADAPKAAEPVVEETPAESAE